MTAKYALRLRNLESGDLLIGEFDEISSVLRWLRQRPHMMEVIGAATKFDGDAETALRDAMRPLDPDEKARSNALDDARLAALEEAVAAQQAQDAEKQEAERIANLHADPDRPIVVAWDVRDGMWVADPADSREINEVVRAAVLAWVAERNSWVHPRRQHVARAMVTVWPGPVPGGDEADRCHTGGQFETEPGAD